MTNWAIGHTDRFAAACTQRSVSNTVDFYGSTDFSIMWEEVFGGRTDRRVERLNHILRWFDRYLKVRSG